VKSEFFCVRPKVWSIHRKKLPPDFVLVSIARGSPRGFTGRKELGLVPTWAMLKMRKPEYNARFAEMLAQLDAAEICPMLGETAVLSCWEKPGDACRSSRTYTTA
jgi:hypothetical protein